VSFHVTSFSFARQCGSRGRRAAAGRHAERRVHASDRDVVQDVARDDV